MVHGLLVFLKKLRTFCTYLATKLFSFSKSAQQSMKYSLQFICQNNPLFAQAIYFTSISFAGYAALKVLKPREKPNTLNDLDLLFTSVSASTVSSMATVEMEDFSSTQLWLLTILMLVGGEVFTSMLGLYFTQAKFDTKGSADRRSYSAYVDIESSNSTKSGPNSTQGTKVTVPLSELHLQEKDQVEPKAIESLDAQGVLNRKGIGFVIFSVFTAISSVGNCGFTPVNENMVIFQKNTILLLLIIPQILAGNTLLAPCLRLVVWSLKKITGKEEYYFILEHPEAIRCKHLMSSKECIYLILTVVTFIITQAILFCSLEWSSEALQEMNSYQKIVGAFFMSTNARHAGESIVDLSSLPSVILVLYTIMMYLPGYTSFLPKDDEHHSKAEMKGKRKRLLENWIFSQLSYLAIFVMLICITEREAMTTDPLNFNVFSILFEVVSAYGNVGFSVSYSCKRLLNHDVHCKDASYGFVGKWSDKGKVILIIVMVFGRLKTFNMKGGRAWKLR
ncbi:cation transporter HKT1;3-like isoform X2 [Phragmites australis]|uniref:cation transporter HKT1;3-like isoform X2 n=1 Tax=Phragmites australis TaxID=29695 RepID=UPI002D77D236|nr:cation transporter HKT1;3-like isoform X2 [Phragmites australis]